MPLITYMDGTSFPRHLKPNQTQTYLHSTHIVINQAINLKNINKQIIYISIKLINYINQTMKQKLIIFALIPLKYQVLIPPTHFKIYMYLTYYGVLLQKKN